MSDNAAYYVTLGGECFEVLPQGKVDPVDRLGLLHKFHLIDLKKKRGGTSGFRLRHWFCGDNVAEAR